MGTDSIGGPKPSSSSSGVGGIGRLSKVSAKESERSDKDKDPQQNFYENPQGGQQDDLAKFTFTEEEFKKILEEFETLDFFKESGFQLRLEKDFPDTIIYICDSNDTVIKRLTVPQFIAAVRFEKQKQKSGEPKTGHLINKKA